MKNFWCVLAVLVLFSFSAKTFAQTVAPAQSFERVEMLVADGDRLREISVRVRLEPDQLVIESTKTGAILKTMSYENLKNAEYSYSKSPRWKTGLGLGAASFAFPPLFLVAIPLGFTKHRRHWLTVRADNDYAVLKISKSIRKVLLPAFETESGLKVEALGESK